MFEILIRKTNKTQTNTDYVHVCPHADIDSVSKVIVSHDIDGEYVSTLTCLSCFNITAIDSLINTDNNSD